VIKFLTLYRSIPISTFIKIVTFVSDEPEKELVMRNIRQILCIVQILAVIQSDKQTS